MQPTRLVTNYDEAKALKEAGWPQEMKDYDTCYAHMDLGFSRTDYNIRNEHPEWEEPAVYRWLDGCVKDLSPAALDAAAPRLDELLAFLWENGWDAQLDIQTGASLNYCVVRLVRSGEVEMNPGKAFSDPTEPIAAAVRAVLHILTSEREATPNPHS